MLKVAPEKNLHGQEVREQAAGVAGSCGGEVTPASYEGHEQRGKRKAWGSRKGFVVGTALFMYRGDMAGVESGARLIDSLTLAGLASEVSAVIRVVLQSGRSPGRVSENISGYDKWSKDSINRKMDMKVRDPRLGGVWDRKDASVRGSRALTVEPSIRV